MQYVEGVIGHDISKDCCWQGFSSHPVILSSYVLDVRPLLCCALYTPIYIYIGRGSI